MLYDGSWDGFFFALDAQTGALKWRIQLDCQASIVPVPEVCGRPPPPWVSGFPDPARFQTAGGIVTASRAVVGDSVYFSGGKTLYRVRAAEMGDNLEACLLRKSRGSGLRNRRG